MFKFGKGRNSVASYLFKLAKVFVTGPRHIANMILKLYVMA